MSPYRKRFVQFNMLLIGIVLSVMVAAVAIYMVNDYYNSLRMTMEQVVAPLQGFSQPPKGEPPKEKPDQKSGKRTFSRCSTPPRTVPTRFCPRTIPLQRKNCCRF